MFRNTRMMKNNNESLAHEKKGLALLVTLVVATVVLGIAAALLNVAVKQYKLSGIAVASEMAFQAAQAGIECAVYTDTVKTPGSTPFDVPGDGTEQAVPSRMACMDQPEIASDMSLDLDGNVNGLFISGGEQRFQYSWGTPTHPVCTEVSVFKFYSTGATLDMSTPLGEVVGSRFCSQNSHCTVIKSRGYNVACADIHNNPRAVEREITQRY